MTPRCMVMAVSKRYGRQWAVREVTFDVNCASIVGLVGPNGAGKTTLLRVMARLLRPSSGAVTLACEQASIAYFGGERTMPPELTVARWRRLWRMRSEEGARSKRIGSLSRGMRQRLGLETVFAHAAERQSLVLLDEPWEGLDPDASDWLSARLLDLRAAGGAALVSSHRMHDLAAACDRCLFMGGGKIVGRVEMPATSPVDRSAMLLEAFERARMMPVA